MRSSRIQQRRIFIPAKQVSELSARTFSAKIKGKVFHGFVVKKDAKVYAYQNLCQHLPIQLDLGSGELFSYDKSNLQCSMHGALYQIETGLCIAGPCLGASLIKLEAEQIEDQIAVTLPEHFEP